MEEALKEENIEKIETLLLEGSDPNEKTKTGKPIIFLTDNQEVIKLLLEYGADPKIEDEYGFKLEDYADDDKLKALLNEPRKPTITKFVKYRATSKQIKSKNKTRRQRCRVEKS
jgi:ankyrin repeat protein